MRARNLIIAVLALCAGLVVLGWYNALPPLDNRSASTALTDTHNTKLGEAVAPLLAAHPGLSGIYPLTSGRDAFAARVLLAGAAERSLDVQYYIWHYDMTGTLLLDALRAAADRGVRVRLLLDDNNTSGMDATLAALDAHPNVEVRLFNPFAIRKPRALGYLTDFPRLNRRMHNKSFTIDNQATIVGGRNVGDEYFGAAEGKLFVDLDLIAVGAVVDEVSRGFDSYWASGSSYPADRVLPPAAPAQIAELSAAASAVGREPAAGAYMDALRQSPFVRELTARTLALEWVVARMISDDPAKGLGLAAPERLLFPRLKSVIGESAKRVNLVSPYFVPTAAGVEALTALAARGVEVRILTNALEATDVAPVHAGYAKRRRALLEAGIKLYELRRLSPQFDAGEAGPMGSSGSSLHSKTFSVDQRSVFVGSFNFDPRSAKLNTEMGFVIESATLAQGMNAVFENRVPGAAYEARLSDSGAIYWLEQRDGAQLRHDREPGTSFAGRIGLWLMSVLPIEWLL